MEDMANEMLRIINLLLSLIAITPSIRLTLGLIKDLRASNSHKRTGVGLLLVSSLFTFIVITKAIIYIMNILKGHEIAFMDFNTHYLVSGVSLVMNIAIAAASILFNRIRECK